MTTKTKSHRSWSPEARAAAAERLVKARAVRMANLERARTDTKAKATAIAELSEQEGSQVGAEVFGDRRPDDPKYKVRDPEVQAVIDSMTPERKAKLEAIQSRNIATLETTHEGQEALARYREAHGIEAPHLPPERIGTREISLIVRTDGTMVSQQGPCVCGAPRRQWHPICLKEAPHGS